MMTQNFPELSETQMEKLLLRALCQPGAGENIWRMALGPLNNYRWREPVHESLFASLRDLRARKPALLHELLPAALTRRGYPDVAWEEFLEPISLSNEDAGLIVQRLLAATTT